MIKSTVNDIVKSSWPSLVIFLTIIILLRLFYLIQSKERFILHKELLSLIFIIYILLLFELVTGKDVNFAGVNWIPFKEIMRYKFGSSSFYKQVLGNVVLFIPFGFFTTRYTGIDKMRHIVFVSFIISGTIEIVQYFIGRSFDVDDILLNVAGASLGFLIYMALSNIRRHLPRFFKSNSFCDAITLLLFVLVIFYFLGLLKEL